MTIMDVQKLSTSSSLSKQTIIIMNITSRREKLLLLRKRIEENRELEAFILLVDVVATN